MTGHLLLVREGRPGDAGRERHRRRARAGRHAGARRLQRRRCRSSSSPPACKLMQTRRPDVMYLSTTDYVQHKHAPGTAGANAFYAMMDGYLGAARRDGLRDRAHRRPRHERQDRAWTATPDVIYLQDRARRLARRRPRARDPADHRPLRRAPRRARLVRHRLPAGRRATCRRAATRIAALRGIEVGADARARRPQRFELPADRIGDLVVVSERSTVIGTVAARHDLSALEVPLRSHGGISEQRVPLIVNRPLAGLDAGSAAGATSTPSTWR